MRELIYLLTLFSDLSTFLTTELKEKILFFLERETNDNKIMASFVDRFISLCLSINKESILKLYL